MAEALSQEVAHPAAMQPTPLLDWLHALDLPRLTVIAVDATFFHDIHLRSPASVVVRGLLGERLRARLCWTGARSCDGCTLWRDCDYAAVFRAGSGQESAAAGSTDLHPFWLQGLPAAHQVAPGTRLTACLVATALNDDMLQSLHLAFRDAVGLLGEVGGIRGSAAPQLSPSRASRRSIRIEPCDANTWWIEARTPLLLPPARGDVHLPPCPQAPWLPRLLGGGIRRLKALAQAFGTAACGTCAPDSTPPSTLLPNLQDTEVVSGALTEWNGAVVKRRQGRSFPLEHGLTGGVLLRGSALPTVGPLLRALEITGVGKKTTMGFGHLAVEAVR